MTEIHKNLFVGSLTDFESIQFNSDFYFVQACKEPCHRKALGYTGRTPDNNHSEYLIAYRDRKIILNMIDPPNSKYFENIQFEKSLLFIDENLKKGNKVLIHCNQGISRSPSIGLLYLSVNRIIRNEDYNFAKEDFMKIYPMYQPSGIKEFLEINWSNYFK